MNPIRTGYNAVADDWIGITPGTDGLLILFVIHELLGVRVDLDYLSRWTNAGCLIDDGGDEKGLLRMIWASPW